MPDAPYLTPDQVVGDIVFTTEGRRPASTHVRADRWERSHAAGDWVGWTTAPSPRWAGFGVSHARVDGVDAWVITDPLPETPTDPAGLATDARAWRTSRQDRWIAVRRSDADGLEVMTDRFATLHVAHATDGAAVGTFAPALTARSTLDNLGLLGFCLLGWYPADRTPLDDVHLVRPATRLRLDGGTAGRESRWHDWCEPTHVITDPADGVRAIAPVLDRALDRQVRSRRVALPISGGLDSRSTVLSLTRPDRPDSDTDLHAFSYGYDPGSIESRIGQRVGERRGLAVERLTILPNLLDDLEPVIEATEAMEDPTLCRQIGVAAGLAERADVVIAAHWGDVWFDHLGGAAEDDTATTARHLLDRSRRPGAGWLHEHLRLGQADAGEAELAVEELLVDEADRVAHLTHGEDRLKALKTDQWSWRWTVTGLRAYQSALSVRTPFYAPELADLLWNIDRDLHRGRALQVAHLRAEAPDLAAVEWEALGAPPNQLDRPLRRLPRRAARAVARRVRRSTPPTANWQVQFAGAHATERLRSHLLDGEQPLHDLVDGAAVATLIDRHERDPGDQPTASAIGTLLAVGAWTERWS